jgi:hypothetical protein
VFGYEAIIKSGRLKSLSATSSSAASVGEMVQDMIALMSKKAYLHAIAGRALTECIIAVCNPLFPSLSLHHIAHRVSRSFCVQTPRDLYLGQLAPRVAPLLQGPPSEATPEALALAIALRHAFVVRGCCCCCAVLLIRCGGGGGGQGLMSVGGIGSAGAQVVAARSHHAQAPGPVRPRAQGTLLYHLSRCWIPGENANAQGRTRQRCIRRCTLCGIMSLTILWPRCLMCVPAVSVVVCWVLCDADSWCRHTVTR